MWYCFEELFVDAVNFYLMQAIVNTTAVKETKLRLSPYIQDVVESAKFVFTPAGEICSMLFQERSLVLGLPGNVVST